MPLAFAAVLAKCAARTGHLNMEVKINVEQNISNGVISDKKYNLSISINDYNKARIYGLSADNMKELIEKLTREIESALLI